MGKFLDLITTPSGLFIVILLFCIVAAKLNRSYHRKRRKEILDSMETLKEALGGNIDGSDKKFLTLKSNYEGMHYECHYFIGGNHPSEGADGINSLEVCVRNCRCRELSIIEGGDLGKNIGLIDKLRTLDKQFDNRFFIETAHMQYAEELLSKQEVRQAMIRAANKGARDFYFTNDTLNTNVDVYVQEERVDLENLQVVLHNLKIIYDNLPPVTEDSQRYAEEKTLKKKRKTTGRWFFLLLFSAIIVTMVNYSIFYKVSLEQEDLELVKNITPFMTIIGTFLMGRMLWQNLKNKQAAVSDFIFFMVIAIFVIYLFSGSTIKVLMELL